MTGASGLLGSELTRLLSQNGHEVIAGYNTHPPSIGQPLRIDLADLNQIEPTVRKARPDTIIHTAATTDVDLCEKDPALAEIVNGKATGKIAEAGNALQSPIIYLSTDYVFEGERGNYREDEEPHPVNQYGRTKLLGEQLLKESGAPYLIARSSVVYGWARKFRPNYATWVLSKLEANEPFNVVTGNCASPTLNLNLAEMIMELVLRRIQGTLHVAGATRIDRYDFAIQIAKTFNLPTDLIKPVKSEPIAWKAKRPTDSSLNVDKAQAVLDRKPLKLHEALNRFRMCREK